MEFAHSDVERIEQPEEGMTSLDWKQWLQVL